MILRLALVALAILPVLSRAGPAAAPPAASAPAAAAKTAPAKDAAPAAAAKDAAAKDAAPPAASIAIRVRVPLAEEHSGVVPVAKVDDVVITVEDLRGLAALTHQDRGEAMPGAGKTDFAKLLERLVAVRVVEAEAREMGLDELDEIQTAVAKNRERVRLQAIRRLAVEDVKPDEAKVKKYHELLAREWNVRSVVFPKQEDAEKFAAALAKGGDFVALAEKARADGTARGGETTRWMRTTEVSAVVVKALEPLPLAKATAPLRVSQGWTLVRVDERRASDDPVLLEQARAEALAEAKDLRLEQHYAALKKQYATIDRKLLKAVSFDAPKGGFAALEKDKRVVARVKGAKPVTIGEVAGAVKGPLFHGVAPAQEQKKLDRQKLEALDALVSKRIVELEATRLGLDERPEVKRQLAEYETNLLFSKFLERVVIPEVKVPEEDLRAAYERKKPELTYPAFYRLEALAFDDAKRAEAALKSLRAGTEYAWLRANSDGLVTTGEKLLRFDPAQSLAAPSIPEEVRKALGTAGEGDVRLVSHDGYHYVVRVAGFTPSQVRPFEEVRPELHKDLFGKALSAALDTWVKNARAAHDVDVYLLPAE